MHISALYESVTNRIIEEMKNGTVPWTKPWKSRKTVGVMPMNAATGRAYSGINIPLLWHSADVHAYSTHEWLTYQQAQKASGQVRKGEKATTVVFTKKLRIKDKEPDEDKQIGMLRTFSVFNVAQIVVAELTAAFLCAHLGIKGELPHADYIASWIELLKEYPRAMFAAASKASQASDYLRSFSGGSND